ncbi:hypothetical protein B0H13DRAFT_1896421 [Mycena leptocephala]|nr:hypothetical protein B0H13DRAFT_1896421 [Mycena leptocephala]
MCPLLPKTESLNHTPTLFKCFGYLSRGRNKSLKVMAIKVNYQLSNQKPRDKNVSPQEQETIKAHRRSTGHRERRQRELATEITTLNVPRGVHGGSIRSRGQRLRRKLKAAKRCLEDDPDYDSTNDLSKAIDYGSGNRFRRRRDLPSYQERMLGRDQTAGYCERNDRERREHGEITL